MSSTGGDQCRGARRQSSCYSKYVSRRSRPTPHESVLGPINEQNKLTHHRESFTTDATVSIQQDHVHNESSRFYLPSGIVTSSSVPEETTSNRGSSSVDTASNIVASSTSTTRVHACPARGRNYRTQPPTSSREVPEGSNAQAESPAPTVAINESRPEETNSQPHSQSHPRSSRWISQRDTYLEASRNAPHVDPLDLYSPESFRAHSQQLARRQQILAANADPEREHIQQDPSQDVALQALDTLLIRLRRGELQYLLWRLRNLHPALPSSTRPDHGPGEIPTEELDCLIDCLPDEQHDSLIILIASKLLAWRYMMESRRSARRAEIALRYNNEDSNNNGSASELVDVEFKPIGHRINIRYYTTALRQQDVPDDLECAICQEAKDPENIKEGWVRPKNCQHVIHFECLSTWINGTQGNCNTCPSCRTPIYEKRAREPVLGRGGAATLGSFDLESMFWFLED